MKTEKQVASRMFWGCLMMAVLDTGAAAVVPSEVSGLFLMAAFLFFVGATAYYMIGFDSNGTRPRE